MHIDGKIIRNTTKEFIHENLLRPASTHNVSTKVRKEYLLDNSEMPWVTRNGQIYDVKFRNLGGGVWQAYLELRDYSKK